MLFENPSQALRELRRRNIVAFLLKAFPMVSAGTELMLSWHVEAIAYELERVICGDERQLIITMPPRNGKSIFISIVFVAFWLGIDPTKNFVCVSYSGPLAEKFGRECLAIMESDWYKELFPRTRIARAVAADFTTTAGGGRLATSVGGTVTGRGGDVVIVDDPQKPDEAYSVVSRANVQTWFGSTLATRLNDKKSGTMILVMQRLHEDDLAGYLLAQGGWRHLTLPAIATGYQCVRLLGGRVHERFEGEVLHPEREPLVELEKLRRIQGSIFFEAQYQQQPVPADGNIVKAHYLHFSEAIAERLPGDQIIQSWDTASKPGARNDWSVCVTAILRRNVVHIIHVYRAKLAIVELVAKAIELARRFESHVLLVEDAASGTQLYQNLISSSPRGVPRPIARRPELDKESRFAGVSVMIESGQMILPKDAPWLGVFKSELLAFPSSRFNDQVDALSQLLDWVRSHANADTIGPPPEVPLPHDIPGGDDFDDDWYDEDEEEDY